MKKILESLASADYFSHYIFIALEKKMAVSIEMLERRARYLMGAAAVIAVAVLAAFKLGWIATAPTYKENAWYLVGGNASFVVTSEYADEAACRREESASAVCRPGRTLLEEARAGHSKQS